jgi:hypothetical protein
VYPNLIATLVEDRRRSYRCGAVASKPQQPCRKCLAHMIWRRHASQCSRSTAKHQANRRSRAWSQILATATSMLRIHAKGVRS